MSRSTFRSFVSSVFSVFAGLVAGLALAEGLARLRYEEPWYDSLPSEQRREELERRPRNSFGLRDRDYPSPKPPGRERVLFLGDSFTFGLGVEDDARTFPEILEKKLGAWRESHGRDGVDVLNGGLPGSLTSRWVRLWHEVAEPFDPDVVIAVFFLRNGTDLRAKEDFFEPLREEIVARNAGSIVYRHSFLYRLVSDRFDRERVSRRYVARFLEAYGEDYASNRQWRIARKNLLELRALAEARGGAFGLVIFPMLVDLGEDYAFEPILDEIRRFAKESELRTFDLMEVFRGRHAPRLWVSAWNQHPNEEAHALVAEGLEPFVRELIASSAAHESLGSDP